MPMIEPLVVVEGSTAAVDRAFDEVRRRGWVTVDGWGTPVPRGGRAVRVGNVDGQADAEAALQAALTGIGVLVVGRADRTVMDRLIDDLRRLGPVDHRVGEPPTEASLPYAARDILGLLAEGYSLRETAAVLGLARRTADRRLAEARTMLGVERTTEAIAIARRRGWLKPASGANRP
jgi:DNA-binding CsgD family transcriptional regulator